MKILMYSTYRPDMVDGASVSGHNLVRALRDRQVDVTVCTTDMGWTIKDIDAHGDRREDPRLFHAWFSHVLELSPGLMLFFCKTIRSFDVIHFRGVFSLGTIFGSFVARRLKKTYIISPVGDRVPSWNERSAISHGTIKYFYSKFFIKRVLQGADYIVCTSEMECNQIIALLNTRNVRVASIPNGLAISAYSTPVERSILQRKLGIMPAKSIYLCLGRLSKEKALEFLIEAWKKVIAQREDSVLVIAGGNKLNVEYVDSLRKMAAALRFPESVLFPGSVSGELKNALLQHSCCLLLPSYRESFGNVVLEALASGTPVLASKGTPWECLETDGLGRWLPWDTDIWAKAMIEQANIAESVDKKFFLRSRQWVAENFNWEKSADRYIRVYQETAKG